MIILLSITLAIIVTEAITEIVTKSEIFSPIREKIFDIGRGNIFFKWLHKLVDCGYCFSVWAAAFTYFILLFNHTIINKYVDCFVMTIFIHRLSNVLHNAIDIFRKN